MNNPDEKPCIVCGTDLAPEGKFGPFHLETPDAKFGVCYNHLTEDAKEKINERQRNWPRAGS